VKGTRRGSRDFFVVSISLMCFSSRWLLIRTMQGCCDFGLHLHRRRWRSGIIVRTSNIWDSLTSKEQKRGYNPSLRRPGTAAIEFRGLSCVTGVFVVNTNVWLEFLVASLSHVIEIIDDLSCHIKAIAAGINVLGISLCHVSQICPRQETCGLWQHKRHVEKLCCSKDPANRRT
jgi:hypothetical protein